MSKKTIDASTVRRVAAELDCDAATVRRVFHSERPPNRPISKRIFDLLVKLGFRDPEVDE